MFVDGLRYDVAQRLRAKLDGLGAMTLAARWTSMPSVTASGKAWCSPVAGLVSGTAEDVEFEPRVAADGKRCWHFSASRKRLSSTRQSQNWR